jgi:hypothetical protein
VVAEGQIDRLQPGPASLALRRAEVLGRAGNLPHAGMAEHMRMDRGGSPGWPCWDDRSASTRTPACSEAVRTMVHACMRDRGRPGETAGGQPAVILDVLLTRPEQEGNGQILLAGGQVGL